MTSVSKEMMIERWETMANSAKLDCKDRYIAREIAEMAKAVFEKGVYRNPSWIVPILNGFIVNVDPESEDFYFVSCLDLNFVEANDYGIDRLDKYLMIYTGWFEKYQKAIGARK